MSKGKTAAWIVAAVIAVICLFVLVLCTAGTPKALEAPADYPAPTN